VLPTGEKRAVMPSVPFLCNYILNWKSQSAKSKLRMSSLLMMDRISYAYEMSSFICECSEGKLYRWNLCKEWLKIFVIGRSYLFFCTSPQCYIGR
jgi:hypothetical protein